LARAPLKRLKRVIMIVSSPRSQEDSYRVEFGEDRGLGGFGGVPGPASSLGFLLGKLADDLTAEVQANSGGIASFAEMLKGLIAMDK
jgi:hypothetical protein